MRYKDKDLMQKIIDYIDDEYQSKSKVPSMAEIADNLKMSKSSVSNYISDMVKEGKIENTGVGRGLITPTMRKTRAEILQIPLVGNISCGSPLLAEENIEAYIPIPKETLGNGDYFALRASGDSMINAGIYDGDLVFVKKQEIAEEGQIIVALINEEATLKRFYKDKINKRIILHPENDNMEDMYFKSIIIQGVAKKVVKDLH